MCSGGESGEQQGCGQGRVNVSRERNRLPALQTRRGKRGFLQVWGEDLPFAVAVLASVGRGGGRAGTWGAEDAPWRAPAQRLLLLCGFKQPSGFVRCCSRKETRAVAPDPCVQTAVGGSSLGGGTGKACPTPTSGFVRAKRCPGQGGLLRVAGTEGALQNRFVWAPCPRFIGVGDIPD